MENIPRTPLIVVVIAILSTFWLWQEPGFEPLITALVSILTLSVLAMNSTQNNKEKIKQYNNIHLSTKKFSLNKNCFYDYNLTNEESHILEEEIEYLDNSQNSDKLIFFFHGLGLDSNDFREYIEKSEYRCIAPTLYGFNKTSISNDTVSYSTHCHIVSKFIQEFIHKIKPQSVTLVGFSIGGDMLQDIITLYPNLSKNIKSVILLDPNINITTCSISNRLASLASNERKSPLNVIKTLSKTIKTLKEWLQIQQYLIKVFSKFQGRISILATFSKEIINRFKEDTEGNSEYFINNYQTMTQRIDYVQFIFSDEDINKKIINQLKLDHLYHSSLGKNYTEKSLNIETGLLHFDFLEYENLKNCISESFDKKRNKEL